MQNDLRRFITLCESLTEGRIARIPYKDYMGTEFDLMLAHDPTPEQARNLINRSENKMLRVLVTDQSIICWDAYYVEHIDIAKLFGLSDFFNLDRLWLIYDNDHDQYPSNIYRLGGASWRRERERYIKIPAIARLLAGGSHEPKYAALNEVYAGAVQIGVHNVDIFRNPSRKEYRSARDNYNEVRAFLSDNDIYVWNVYGATHMTVRNALHLPHETVIPLIIFGRPGSPCIAEVTDHSQNTIWAHNGKVVEAIQNHPYMRSMFPKSDVSFYDDDIVGDWRNIDLHERLHV